MHPIQKYSNIKLAIARAMHACGAADIIAEMYGDDDDDEAIVNQPVYLVDLLFLMMFFSVDSMIDSSFSTSILFPKISTVGVPWPCLQNTKGLADID
jgi:hypothetical protein